MQLSKEFLQDISLGTRGYLIVSSKTIARRYAEELLEMAPNEGVLFNIPIFSIEDFISHFFEKFEINNKKNIIDGFTQEIIIIDILRNAAKKFEADRFFLHSKKPEFAVNVAEAIRDIKAARLTPDEFRRLFSKESKHLHLAEIYREYEEYLSRKNLMDYESAICFLTELISISDKVQIGDYCFYFENLYDLSTIKRELINSISQKAKKCSMSFIASKDQGIETWLKKLESDLPYVDFTYDKVLAYNALNIKALEACNQSEEAVRISALIKQLILEEGYLAKDICLVTNSSSNLQRKLFHSLKDAQIPNDLKLMTPLANFTAISACIDLLSCSLRKYDKLDVMKLYVHDIFGGGKAEVSLVKRTLNRKNLRMDLNTWRKKAKDNGKFLEFLNKLDIAWNEISLDKKYSLSKLVLMTKRMFRDLSVEQNIIGLDDLNERALLWSLWNSFLEVLKKIESAEARVSNLNWSWEEFVFFLRNVVSRTHIDMSRNIEQGVVTLNPHDIFGQSFKVVILSGMNEGDFPKPKQSGWMLTRADREILSRKGIEIAKGSDGILRGKAALRAAIQAFSDMMFVSFSKADDQGQAMLISSAVEDVLGISKATKEDKKDSLEEKIISPNTLKRYVPELINSESIVPETFEVFVDDTKDMIAKLRAIYSDGFTRYDGMMEEDIELISEVRSRLLIEDIWSASTLKDYIDCPFKFLCRKLLKIDDVQDMEEEAGSLDLGNVSHEILNKTFSEFKGRYIGHEVECNQYVDDIAEDVFSQIDMDKVDIHQRVWDLQRAGWIRKIKKIVDQEIQFISEGNWLPLHFEWSFGQVFDPEHEDPSSTEMPLELEFKGEKLKFKGKVDRIDVNDCGMMAIYDYKLRVPPKAVEISKKVDIQMALYILAVGKLLKKSISDVAGGTYYSIKDAEPGTGMWQKSFAPILRAKSKRNNKFDIESWVGIEEDMTKYLGDIIMKIKAGNFVMNPRDKCENLYCPYKDICGYDPDIYEKKMR